MMRPWFPYLLVVLPVLVALQAYGPWKRLSTCQFRPHFGDSLNMPWFWGHSCEARIGLMQQNARCKMSEITIKLWHVGCSWIVLTAGCCPGSTSCSTLGRFNTMDHETGPRKMGFFHGPTWWSNNTHGPVFGKKKKKAIHKVFGPLTRCKPNADQEEWPCTNNERADFLDVCLKKGNFERKGKSLIIRLSSLVFIHLLFPEICFNKNKIMTSFLYHGPLPFCTRAPLLSFPPQNPLDHVSG